MLSVRVGASCCVEFELCQVFWFLEGKSGLLLKVPQGAVFTETAGKGAFRHGQNGQTAVYTIFLASCFGLLWEPSTEHHE